MNITPSIILIGTTDKRSGTAYVFSLFDAQRRTVLEIRWIFLAIPSIFFLPRVYVLGEKFRRNNGFSSEVELADVSVCNAKLSMVLRYHNKCVYAPPRISKKHNCLPKPCNKW